MTDPDASLATGQRSLGDPEVTFPLFPPLVAGCPTTSTDAVQYPLEVDYDYDRAEPGLFDQPPLPGLRRWQPLLPPLDPGMDLGAGGTPLVAAGGVADAVGYDGELLVKDESANPTWSHKDRLAYAAVSAAKESGAPGVVVASSGNHGAATAAHAARADLPCVVVTSTDVAGSMDRFLRAYGAAVVGVPRDRRWDCVRALHDRLGYQPVSNLTRTHTGHPFGPEGYKTVGYELFRQLDGRAPGTVFVPTGYAELLYGVWKGFRELSALGVADATPRMVACEPAARAPLSAALAADEAARTVAAAPTDAASIGVTVGGYRGVRAVRESGGTAYALADGAIRTAQDRLAADGHWQELSAAAGVAGLAAAVDAGDPVPGPAVAVCTSSGFKDPRDGASIPEVDPDRVLDALAEEYGLGPPDEERTDGNAESAR
ncbi:MAG: pyridoxal-phosphate dependent enzyme [Haloferacaceae archaeon]